MANRCKWGAFLWLMWFTSQPAFGSHYYVFVGSYNWDKTKNGIYVYELDTISGALMPKSVVGGVLNPSFISLSPNGEYLYACTETQTAGAGSVTAFSFDTASAQLSYINSQRSEGENPVYFAIISSGWWLLNANYTEASVSAYSLSANGSILPPTQVISFRDSSINRKRQDKAHIHAAVFSPNEDYIFFPDLGADKIRCYSFDGSTNHPLQPAYYPYTKTYPGSGPRHIVFHPNGRFCYCIEEMGGAIEAFSYFDGKLKSLQRIFYHKKGRHKQYSGADIHITPDGQMLIASNRAKVNALSLFAIDPKTGFLTAIGKVSTHGDHPRMFDISPDGKFVIVANQLSGNLVVFKRDKVHNTLEYTGVNIDIPGASCVQIRKY